ncbi:hypothetical protein WN48_09310 [Eufriesea mexicana]|uniref:Uncharacterized protein n=1 Tax=Eufriesea mexicana TaxID=516756 RepID=A0A310SHP8_9HYME|nr:hypothetical protein WN48_09310 [Eufriesea mexicana]
MLKEGKCWLRTPQLDSSPRRAYPLKPSPVKFMPVEQIVTTALGQLNEASLTIVEDEEEDYFFDCPQPRGDFLIGWDEPNVRMRPRWTWLGTTDITPKRTDVRIPHAEWERIKQVGRVRLPKRSTQELGSYISRGGLKMQQFWVADPDFWEGNRV